MLMQAECPECGHQVLNHKGGRCVVKLCSCMRRVMSPQLSLDFGVPDEFSLGKSKGNKSIPIGNEVQSQNSGSDVPQKRNPH